MDEAIKRELEIIKKGILQTTSVEAIYLFGSYAYGTPHKNSDLDIYVVVPDSNIDTLDLALAEHACSMHPQPLKMIYFLCQQAAEKYLKGLLNAQKALSFTKQIKEFAPLYALRGNTPNREAKIHE